MRVAYFSESLLPLVDGVSLTLDHLFTTLEERGIEFRVYAPFVPGAEVGWSHRVRRLPSFAFPMYRDYKVSLPLRRGLEAELDAFAPDVVHVVSPTPTAVWAQRYARKRGVPVVATFHTHFVSYFRYYGLGMLERFGWELVRRFYDRCDAVFAPSPSIIRELESHGIENLRLWSRGIDTARFSPEWRDEALRAELDAGEDAPLVLFVSRLVKEKDLADLVEMDRLLRERGVDFRLALVGEGPMRQELERALPHARFAGHQSGQELSRWYASADVFVFPSTTETFANVVLEAQASGLPAVVVDRGGPQDVISAGETGLVARANRPTDLADHVEWLIRDAATRRHMGRKAREWAEGRCWAAVNARLIEGYHDAARGRPEARRPVRRTA